MKYRFKDFIEALDPSLCDYSIEGEKSKKTVVTIRSNDKINNGLSMIKIPIQPVSYGEHIIIDAVVKNNTEKFGVGFCNVHFFRSGKPLINQAENGNAFSSGECQFYGHGYKDYQYKYTVPYGTDSVEVVIYCKNDGTLKFKNIETYICNQVPTVYSHNQGIKCVAHLGMSGYAPRNTMSAFSLAKRAGYSECVTNTNFTKDGYLVALHNDKIDETSNGIGCIHDMTLAEARQYDFGGYVDEVYKGTEIPLLEDVLKFMSKSGMRPVIRLSHNFRGENKWYLQKIYKYIKTLGLDKRCSAKAFDKDVLEELSKIAGDDIRYGYCCKEFSVEDIEWLKNLGSDVYFDLRYRDITEEKVLLAMEYNVAVEAWIINDFEAIVKLSEMGVTGFTTDFYCLDGCIL